MPDVISAKRNNGEIPTNLLVDRLQEVLVEILIRVRLERVRFVVQLPHKGHIGGTRTIRRAVDFASFLLRSGKYCHGSS